MDNINHNHKHNGLENNKNFIFALSVILNLTFVLIEVFLGIFAKSMALLADSGHNLSDVAGLLIAWGAGWLATKPATKRRTYGFKKITIFASLFNSIMLLFVLGGIAWESIRRVYEPVAVEGRVVLLASLAGIVINSFTALLFFKGQKEDLNIKGAFLHMVADASVSAGVLISGVVIILTGFYIIDPIVSIIIVLIIVYGTYNLLRDSLKLALDFVPESIDYESIKEYFLSLENVCQIHDLHIWAMSTTQIALTVHIVLNEKIFDDNFLSKIQKDLKDKFNIDHATVQIESPDGEKCNLDNQNI